MNTEPTGEHFHPHKTGLMEMQVNIDRYFFALQYLQDKVVIDLGCGAGLGTYLYSMVAKKVIAVDYNAAAIEHARKFPFAPGKVEFMNLDIRDPEDLAKLPKADVVVALEVLEHLEDPAATLKALRAPQLVFSVPMYSMEVSTWHRFPINSENDVRKLIGQYYDVGKLELQEHERISGQWIRGEGMRLL